MSGYSSQEMEKYATPDIVGYDWRVVRDSDGGVPVHRKGAVIRKLTNLKKLAIKSDWYIKKPEGDKYRVKSWGGKKMFYKKSFGSEFEKPCAPLFVPRTPNGLLVIKLKKI